jgi:NTE family protein
MPMTSPDPVSPDVWADPGSDRGYTRNAQLQQDFEAAAEHLRQVDGYIDPLDPAHRRQLRADLALEGGGVKGIGLAGAVLALDEAGYSFARVAGTSAGSIAACLVASISRAGKPMTALRAYLSQLVFARFMPEGKIHHFLDQLGGTVEKIDDAAILTQRIGLYPGAYLAEWLQPILSELGVRTFADLKIDQSADPGMSLPPNRRYRLVVHVSDITRGELVQLPWDYGYYGLPADEQDIAGAVRASMSIPFFFQPVTIQANEATVDVAMPDGSSARQHYDAGAVTWVDGGMLRNFPIGAFDRVDGQPPRWPTIGIKLSSLQTQFPGTEACDTALSVAIRALHTMMNEWDRYNIETTTAARTIFVANAGLRATQFDLTADQQDQLFINGVRAATRFVIEMSHAGGVPRDTGQAKQLLLSRKAAASPLVAGELAQRCCLLHRHGLVTHLNPAASLEPAQRGVDALPGPSDLMRELLLRHSRPDHPVLPPGLAEQHLGHTPGQVQEHQVRRCLGQPPQARRHRDRQRLRHRRHPPAQPLHHRCRDEQQTAVLQGLGISGPGPAVDGTDLAEHTTGTDDRQRQLTAVRRPDHHLDPAGQHHDHGIARIARGEQHLTAAEGPRPGRRRDRLQIRGRSRTEQISRAQDIRHVSAHPSPPGGGRCCPLSRHGHDHGCRQTADTRRPPPARPHGPRWTSCRLSRS